jgi:hypothetical protein
MSKVKTELFNMCETLRKVSHEGFKMNEVIRLRAKQDPGAADASSEAYIATLKATIAKELGLAVPRTRKADRLT